MSIRTKILLGFLILVLMLFISGALSLFELNKLGRAVKGLITDNYRSIYFSRQMLDAIEQQEKALLAFTSSGDTVHLKSFKISAKVIELNIDSARTTLVIESEKKYLDSIITAYKAFYLTSVRYFELKNCELSIFLEEVHPSYIKVAYHMKQLMTLNQSALYKTAAFLETSSQRVGIPGLIVIVTSIIFTLVFIYLVNYFFVSPIIRLTRAINDYVKFKKPFDVPIETKDEIYTLRESIASLINYYRAGSQKKGE